jgi:hypothetical protein
MRVRAEFKGTCECRHEEDLRRIGTYSPQQRLLCVSDCDVEGYWNALFHAEPRKLNAPRLHTMSCSPLIVNNSPSNPSWVQWKVYVVDTLSFFCTLKSLARVSTSFPYAPFRHITTTDCTRNADHAKLPSGSWRAQVRRKGRYVSETFLRRDDALRWHRLAEVSVDRNETPVSSRIGRSWSSESWCAFTSRT